MPRFIGPTELIIILVIVILIFGVGKLGDIGGALGRSIREFKKGVNEDPQEEAPRESATEDTKAVKE